jgi:hypothetical protein
MAAVAASLLLAACATSSPNATAAAGNEPVASASLGMRDLTPQEKQTIVAAVTPSLKNPAAAKYRWAKFPVLPASESVNYCATVDAQSPYPAYNGRQSYIVEATVVGGRVSKAVLGLIAGGKDAALVTKMCAKYGLDPNDAS